MKIEFIYLVFFSFYLFVVVVDVIFEFDKMKFSIEHINFTMEKWKKWSRNTHSKKKEKKEKNKQE